MTFSITNLNITSLSTTTLSITNSNVMVLSTTTHSITFTVSRHFAECLYADWHYEVSLMQIVIYYEYHVFIVMLMVIMHMLSVNYAQYHLY